MAEVLTLLMLPFSLPFMRDALLIALLVAVPCALLSCFLVLKGWSLMGDATAHAVLPGVVLAHMLGLPLLLGAFAAGMLCALGAGYFKAHSRLKQDALLGVVFSGMFGLGLVMFVWAAPGIHLDHILFGDMLGVGRQDLLNGALIALVVVAALLLRWRDLLLHAFDPGQAHAMGLPVRLLHYGLLALLSLTIVGALKAVGITLVIAMLIAPGATAFLLVRSFGWMLLVALLIAVAAALLGVYLSFFIDSAPAPTVVLLLAAAFVLAFAREQWCARQRITLAGDA